MNLFNKIKYHITNSLKKRSLNISRSSVINSFGIQYKNRIEIIGENNFIEINKGSHLQYLTFFIKGNNNKIIIGENVQIKSGTLWIEDDNNLIFIDSNTTIEGAHISVTEFNHSIKIGKDCMLSHDIIIRNGDSHSIIDLKTEKRINFAKDILIDDHVWVGAHSTILKGVEIGSGSIIGIKSLVTKSIPPHTLAAGAPTRIIKSDINWDRNRIY